MSCSECGIEYSAHPCNWCLPSGRPATRIGRTVIFPGGRCVRLTHFGRLLFALGLKTSVRTPR